MARFARFRNFLKNLFTIKRVGIIAIIGWIFFGIFYLYCATTPISVPIVQKPTAAVVQSQAPSWPSRDECERYYALTLHEAPAGRCR